MFRMIPTGLALAVLMGCASEPAPLAPPEFYEQVGGMLAVVDVCSPSGFMSSDVAGKALYLADYRQKSTSYRYWPNQIEQRRTALREKSSKQVSKEFCAQAASYIEAIYLETAQLQRSQVNQSPAYPTNTNCTTYFGNTHCTSY